MLFSPEVVEPVPPSDDFDYGGEDFELIVAEQLAYLSDDDVQPDAVDPDALFTRPQLEKLFLAIHTHTGIIICVKCKRGPDPSVLGGHECIKRAHNAATIPGLVSDAMRIISAQPDVLDNVEKMGAWFRKQHDAPHREIFGLLPSIPGVKCEKCKLVFSSPKQASDHDRKKHAVIVPAMDTTEESWSYEPMLVSVRVQQPFCVVGKLKSYMEVVAIEPALPQPQPQPESNAILAARNVYEQVGSVPRHLQSDLAQQTVNTPPWMTMLGWDVVIRDSRFADSYAAIHNAELSSGWSAALTSVVKLSFDAVQRDIAMASYAYLQALGTSGELQSPHLSRHMWRHIMSGGCQYMDTLVCFLSAVLVAATDTEGAVALRGLLKLVDGQLAAAADLQRLLVQDSAKLCSCTALEPAMSDSFWSLMYVLFVYKWRAYSSDANWTWHPVMVFLCLHGWRGTELHKPHRLRPFTSHLIYWIRAAVHTAIQRNIAVAKTAWERNNRANGLVHSCQPRVVCNMVDICDLDSASDVADFGSHGAFDDGPIIQKWHLLVRDSMSTPCGALFHTAQILKNAEDSCRTSNIVDWVAESHYTSMHYGGQLISIRDIGDTYYGAVADITAAMAPELAHFTEAQLAKLSVCKDIAENCINDTMGYSFLTDERNNYAALYGSHLADAKFDNGDFTYEAAAGAVELDRTAMHEWLGRMDALLDTITFAIHISGGQPARAPELASIMLQNDQISRRSIFAKRDTLCLVTTYWKGQSIYQSQREVARYLPKELAQLVLQYLVLIRPCIRRVAIILLANDAAEQRAIARAYDDYLFARNGQPTTAVHLRQSFVRHWALYTKYDVNFRDYRQFSRAFIINLCHAGKEENMQLISSDGNEEDISPGDFMVDLANLHGQQLMDTSIDFQAGHSNNIAERVYGRSNETMANISSLVDMQFFIISGLWHLLLRKYHMLALSVVPAIVGNKRTADFDLTHAPAAKRTITEAADSSATHHTTIIQFYSHTPQHHSTTFIPELPPIDVETFSAADKALRLFFPSGKLPSFKSLHQHLAICRALEAKHDLMVILPTGGGKSLVFQLPAHYEGDNHVTIVISLLNALSDDMAAESAKLGITAHLWNNDIFLDPATTGGVVIVGVEAATGSQQFATFVESVSHLGRLRRIVIDKCHLYLTWPEFRHCMAMLRSLRPSATPLLFMSATVIPGTEAAISDMFRITLTTSLAGMDIVRAPTSRPNIKYTVCCCNSNTLAERELMTRVAVAYRALQEGEMVLVFCLQKATVWNLCAKCPDTTAIPADAVTFFHSIKAQLGAAQPDQGLPMTTTMEQLRQGKYKVVFTSCALSVGINLPHVRTVIHYGCPDNLLNFAQESGCAGRDGRPAHSIFVTHKGDISRVRSLATKRSNKELAPAFLAICDWVENKQQCRRIALHQLLDGNAITCSSSSGINPELCDFCSGTINSSAANQPSASVNTLASNCITGDRVDAARTSSNFIPYATSMTATTTASSTSSYSLSNLLPPPATELIPHAVERLAFVDEKRRLCAIVTNVIAQQRAETGLIKFCFICHATNPTRSGSAAHTASNCSQFKSQRPWRCYICADAKHSVRDCPIRGTLTTSGWKETCYFCTLLQELHSSNFGNGNCRLRQFRDNIYLIPYIVWRTKGVRGKMLAHFKLPDITTYADYAAWLMQNSNEMLNASRVLLWYIEQQIRYTPADFYDDLN